MMVVTFLVEEKAFQDLKAVSVPVPIHLAEELE